MSLIHLQDFRLRLVGHSLGGATASLLAIMLRRKSHKELGFNPDIVSAVGLATPPCVSREVAEGCSSYVTTVVMQVQLHSFKSLHTSLTVEVFINCKLLVLLLSSFLASIFMRRMILYRG